MGERTEELADDHAGGAVEQTTAYAGNLATNLGIVFVGHGGAAIITRSQRDTAFAGTMAERTVSGAMNSPSER